MYRFVKRFLDIFLSIFALIITLPLDIVIAVIIKATSKGPIIFKQERLGKNGMVFKMYKFRSMINNSEHVGSGVYSGKGDPRVTSIGKFIRKTSIDEIPQFLNVLKGEMSFIGPRPVLTYHPWPYDKYTNEQKKRFNVRPGITGWAQVHGRKTVEWSQRLKYDVYYVDNMTLLLDVKIVFKTIKQVILSKENENVGETVKKEDK